MISKSRSAFSHGISLGADPAKVGERSGSEMSCQAASPKYIPICPQNCLKNGTKWQVKAHASKEATRSGPKTLNSENFKSRYSFGPKTSYEPNAAKGLTLCRESSLTAKQQVRPVLSRKS